MQTCFFAISGIIPREEAIAAIKEMINKTYGKKGEEIIKRNYLLVGFAAWSILLALAVTSIPRLRRSMGRAWNKLHNWIYLVAILAPLHFLWSVKSGLTEPLMYFAIALFLLFLRRDKLLRPLRHKKRNTVNARR